MMKKSLLLILILFSVQIVFAQKVKIACAGNSITYGAGVSNRDKNSYPAQLQSYLGEEFDVQNFGVSGGTLLHQGDYPYIQTDSYRQSLAFEPDIVFIKLGTNDSKPQNIKYKNSFKTDLLSLIHNYRKLPSSPRVILLTPLRCFLKDEDIKNEVIQEDLVSIIQQVAYEEKVEIVDMYHLFGDIWDSSILPDKLHPSSIGTGIMARHLYEYLSTDRSDVSIDAKNGDSFNFYGYQGYEYQVNGVKRLVVMPKSEAKGKPWLIRARFWGHEPQTDIALLERGFYITYCDVSDLYGSDEAVSRWNRFYEDMIRLGLNKKVVLEGMSRGGLIVYNWAVKNTNKVACIYADAPVMDIKSWPLGKYSAKGSKDDTRNLMIAYSFTDEDQMLKWENNPVNHAKKIAKAKIPILHIVGDADEVVPVVENTAVFESQMAKEGHPIRVIHKKGVGHHPHSLNNPQEIVQFILKSTNRSQNFCAYPVPGNEYRSAAGWREGSDWHLVAEDITRTLLQTKQLDLLLLGNSITQGFGGSRKLVTYKPGKKPADEIWNNTTWESAGISGDRTQHLLWRLKHGNYNASNPRNVVITIGINNLVSGGDTVDDTTKGIQAVAEESRKQFPQARILLLGMLPSGAEENDEIRIKCNLVHKALEQVKWKDILYINPGSWFINKDGSLKTELYANDYLHLNEEGYRVWCQQIKNTLF